MDDQLQARFPPCVLSPGAPSFLPYPTPGNYRRNLPTKHFCQWVHSLSQNLKPKSKYVQINIHLFRDHHLKIANSLIAFSQGFLGFKFLLANLPAVNGLQRKVLEETGLAKQAKVKWLASKANNVEKTWLLLYCRGFCPLTGEIETGLLDQCELWVFFKTLKIWVCSLNIFFCLNL